MEFNMNCLNFLLGVDAGIVVLISVLFALAGIGGGIGIGILIYKAYTKKTVGGVKDECERMKREAREESKTYLKEAKIEAKEEQHRLRKEFERESKEQKAEIARNEQRVAQREDQLVKRELAIDKKSDAVDEKKKQLEDKEKELENIEQELQSAHSKMLEELEKVAKLTQDEAKDILMNELIDDVKKYAAVTAKEIEQKAKDEAEKKAKNIVGMAIQRCAADHASEIAVSVVQLPNEDMKGRLIGRVGRNIRAIENSTGVDLIIDDTPDVVTVSGFDPVRREIAKLTIERLVADGRIHPAKIEETVEKVKREIEQQMKEAGIEFEIQKVDDAAYIDLRSNGEVQVAFSTWYADIVDPDNFLYTILHSESSPFMSSNYNNPEFDALLEEARVVTDPAEREALYREAEALAVTVDFVNVPLYNPIKFYLVQENVEGAKFLNSMVDLFYVTKS